MTIAQALEIVEVARQLVASYALRTDSPEPVIVDVADLLDAMRDVLVRQEGGA